jgi:hypothetical protein
MCQLGAAGASQGSAPGCPRGGQVSNDLFLAGARLADAVHLEDKAARFGAVDGGLTAKAGVNAAERYWSYRRSASRCLLFECESHEGGWSRKGEMACSSSCIDRGQDQHEKRHNFVRSREASHRWLPNRSQCRGSILDRRSPPIFRPPEDWRKTRP